jgi:hypothetical protein
VDNDRHAVTRQSDIKLYPVCAVDERALERDNRILRRDRRRPAMANDEDGGRGTGVGGQWLSVGGLDS